MTWFVVLGVLVGHFALHLTLFNRLNATGMSRPLIKRLEKGLVASAVLVPLAWMLLYGGRIAEVTGDRSMLDPVTAAYGWLCLTCVVVLTGPWLIHRPIFGRDRAAATRQSTRVDVASTLSQPLALTRKCRWASRIPGNQIFSLSVEEIELAVIGLPAPLDGWRLAHLSDVHFTGQISPEFTRYVVDAANAWAPDAFMLTGDVVDFQSCIEWIRPTLGRAVASDGCFFVLGNHDTRVADPDEVRRALEACGWCNVGGRSLDLTIRNVGVRILGNELPWFPAVSTERLAAPRDDGRATAFRVLLSHSPDQLSWARRHGVEFMLAGHTHGGQGRLPLIGPLLTPSWHGSRFSSGDFFLAPTTLHVSRGLSGVHLLRINCPPELSLITLRQG